MTLNTLRAKLHSNFDAQLGSQEASLGYLGKIASTKSSVMLGLATLQSLSEVRRHWAVPAKRISVEQDHVVAAGRFSSRGTRFTGIVQDVNSSSSSSPHLYIVLFVVHLYLSDLCRIAHAKQCVSGLSCLKWKTSERLNDRKGHRAVAISADRVLSSRSWGIVEYLGGYRSHHFKDIGKHRWRDSEGTFESAQLLKRDATAYWEHHTAHCNRGWHP